jgi:hypothetical protein
MKPNFKILLIAALLVTAPLFMFAQPFPGDPKPGTEVGGPPAGAPIGNGTVILLTLAAAYALRKAYEWRQAKDEVTE